MGKKQHQKDRMFLTSKEWKEEWGGYKDKQLVKHQRLPFYCCAISFTNFEDPVCADDGTVFDVTNIVPYIDKHHSHPVTGAPLELGDLTGLTFHKNSDGEFECPILKKVFTQYSHIVAIKTSGNVFSYDAVQKFNIRIKAWNDLLSDEPFTKADIIHIQNPNEIKVQTTEEFDHVKRNLSATEESEEAASTIRNANRTMLGVLTKLKEREAGSGAGAGGGGGELAEPTSRRALAMAQLEAAIREKNAAKAKTAAHLTKGKPGGAIAAATKAAQAGALAKGCGQASAAQSAAKEEEEEDDWRLRGPARKPPGAAFKPGTSTWDTDDAKEAQRKIGKRALDAQRALEGTAKAPRRGPGAKGSVDPGLWWVENYKPRFEAGVETVGLASRSITSTTSAIVTTNEHVMKLVHRDPKEKGYLSLLTSKGSLNIELHCDIAPRTCENFLALAEMGYYNGTRFHRSIRNFMLQGGDPNGTGRGGESIYGATFPDELDSRLVHDRRGILAMANSGKDTNGSQFYILYKSARHLDYKHTVFGTVVGGLETLSAIEAVRTDSSDRPLETVAITGCTVHRNPYRNMIAEEEKAAAAKRDAEKVDASGNVPDAQRKGKWFSNPQSGISQLSVSAAPVQAAIKDTERVKKPKAQVDTSEFDAW